MHSTLPKKDAPNRLPACLQVLLPVELVTLIHRFAGKASTPPPSPANPALQRALLRTCAALRASPKLRSGVAYTFMQGLEDWDDDGFVL